MYEQLLLLTLDQRWRLLANEWPKLSGTVQTIIVLLAMIVASNEESRDNINAEPIPGP